MPFKDNQIISLIGSIKRQIDHLQPYFVPSQLEENQNTSLNPCYQEILDDYAEEIALSAHEPELLIAQSKQLEPKLTVYEEKAFILEELNRTLAILETPPSHEKILSIYHQIKADTRSLSKDFLTSLDQLEAFKKVLTDNSSFKTDFLRVLILSFETKLLEDPKQYKQSMVDPLITCIRQIQNVPADNIEQCYQFLKTLICSNPDCIHPSVDTSLVVNDICTTIFSSTSDPISSPILQNMLTELKTSELTPAFFEHIEQIRTAQITLNSSSYRFNELENIFATRVLAEQDRFSSLVRVAQRTALTNLTQESAIQDLEKEFSIPAEIRLLLEDNQRTFVTLAEIYPIITNKVLETLDPFDAKKREGLPALSKNLPLKEADKINKEAALLLCETNKIAAANKRLDFPLNVESVKALLEQQVQGILSHVDERARYLNGPHLLSELIGRKTDTPILNQLRSSLSSEEQVVLDSFISDIKNITFDALTKIGDPTTNDRNEISSSELHQIFSQCQTLGANTLAQLNDIESKHYFRYILKTIVNAVRAFFHLKPATGFFSPDPLKEINQFQQDLDLLLAPPTMGLIQ